MCKVHDIGSSILCIFVSSWSVISDHHAKSCTLLIFMNTKEFHAELFGDSFHQMQEKTKRKKKT